MTRFKTWLEAREAAIARAKSFNMDIAIRKTKEYGVVGFNVTFASVNDSDYVRAEIVHPTDQI